MSQNHLIIGLGGTGGRVLKELKKLSSGSLSRNCGMEFLHVDSTSGATEAEKSRIEACNKLNYSENIVCTD